MRLSGKHKSGEDIEDDALDRLSNLIEDLRVIGDQYTSKVDELNSEAERLRREKGSSPAN